MRVTFPAVSLSLSLAVSLTTLTTLGIGCSAATNSPQGQGPEARSQGSGSSKMDLSSGSGASRADRSADLNQRTSVVGAEDAAKAQPPMPARLAPLSSGTAFQGRPAGDDLRDQQGNLGIGAEERKRAYDYFMRIGRDGMSNGSYDAAARAFEEAVNLRADSGEAQRLLANARQLLGKESGRSFSEFQSARDQEYSQITEGTALIRQKRDEGQRAFENKNYKDAIASFSEALEICRWLSGRADTTNDQRYMKAMIEKAKEMAGQQQRDELEYNTMVVKQIQEIEKQNRVRRWNEEIRTLYDSAKDQFDREQFDECLITLAKILWKDPYNEDVIRLREYCRGVSQQRTNVDLRKKMADSWATMQAEIEDAAIPRTGGMWQAELPSIERWREIEQRAQRVLESQTTQENPEVVRIKDVLRQKDVNLHYRDMPLKAVIADLSEKTGVNMVLTDEIRNLPDDQQNVNAPYGIMKLSAALSILADLMSISYYIEHGAVIICTAAESSGKGMQTRIFNIKDLLGGLRPFPAEQIRVNRGQPDFQDAQVDPAEAANVIAADQLPDVIKRALGENHWADPATITNGPNGTIVAKNTPEMLAQTAKLLDDLRASRGLMVTIECRIMQVQDNFLEEIGIDFRGSGGIPPGAAGPNLTAAPLDEFQFGLQAANINSPNLIIGRDQSVGLYYPGAPDYEVRARVEQIFDQALGDPDVMTRNGGASFQFAFIDRAQINAILRATKKRERATVVTAPKITCFNTQRANLTIRSSVAYIQDYNAQAQANVTIADPVVDTIEDGLVLDVRPVISADRRYVTVEIQPTLALLKRPFDTLTTTLGGAGSTPVTIQLPEVEVRRIRTTVTVPDGGAFIVGGVRRLRDEDNSTGVPLISDIPILGNLFTRRGRSKLQEDLVIMVTARITDLQEMISTQDPGSAGSAGNSGGSASPDGQ